MVSSDDVDYYPTEQGPLYNWEYKTTTKLTEEYCYLNENNMVQNDENENEEDDEDWGEIGDKANDGEWDWPKYTAEDMILEIEEQMKLAG